jgi:gamma-glutamyltranspeptidase
MLDIPMGASLPNDLRIFFIKNQCSSIGAKSIGVPGVVAAMKEAHAKFGLLEWASLFEPSISMCENGIPISFNEADALVQKDLLNKTLVPEIHSDPMLR